MTSIKFSVMFPFLGFIGSPIPMIIRKEKKKKESINLEKKKYDKKETNQFYQHTQTTYFGPSNVGLKQNHPYKGSYIVQ